MTEVVCMDQPTSLVIAGCLCVVAASLVVLVILRLHQTFCASSSYVRVPAVVERSANMWNRSADSSSSSRLTNSGTERRPEGVDNDDSKTAMLPP